MNEHSRVAIDETDTRARFTASEFVRMVDAGAFDDMKVELVRGELERMPPPHTRHGSWQVRVVSRLVALVSESMLFAEIGIDLGQDTIVGCDAAVVHATVAENRLLRPTDVALVVEVAVSSISRDLGMKRALYAEAGVACYWVVDPERGVTHIYREPVAGEYRTVATVPFDEPLTIPDTDMTITLN